MSTTQRWQQREISKQRGSERRMKWIVSSNSGGPINMGEAASLDGYASEDEGHSDVNTPSTQGIKVPMNVFIIKCN